MPAYLFLREGETLTWLEMESDGYGESLVQLLAQGFVPLGEPLLAEAPEQGIARLRERGHLHGELKAFGSYSIPTEALEPLLTLR
ncbi:hypothetical protein [Aeromonas schubertii]|uniref:Uncharacterized protein n=1 Tax=Aeromonas schubertii TaxID=652 RepID=A0A0S2SJF4_9GAMM|nr:hypothetical protein [Aeromonas schubertii]ALP41839.1 hypothetical protein WL1483_2420 [Aeromonas schubertii]KUE78788.1 hypothetical protein ATO46_08340 [Aeromonas schubertii]MBZ6065631.1 hypothetical protein [Aeromonas schubertii]MBZ6072563.1 hypothetical protein [Aeromonas schubertii]QCG46936.1 hypothetical protein E2P79_02860 [Aeromonas schubertii]